MKTISKIITVAALTMCSAAFGQDLAPIVTLFPSVGALMPGSTTSNFTSVAPITLKRDNGIAILPMLTCTNGTTAATTVTLNFDLSADGTTYTTTTPISYAVTMAGTNNVNGYKLFPPSVLNHMRYIRLSSIANANTNIVGVTGVYVSYFNKFQ